MRCAPPFAEAALRTIVTPWLIDIIDEDLARFAARINQLLAPGGAWINFGSVSFCQGELVNRLSHEESLEVVAKAGFAVKRQHEARIPYMQSPASRHARLETARRLVRREGAQRAGTARAQPPARTGCCGRIFPCPCRRSFRSSRSPRGSTRFSCRSSTASAACATWRACSSSSAS